MQNHVIEHVIRDLELSRHFLQRWSQRVSNGLAPQLHAVRTILRQSVVLQRGREIQQQNGKRYRTLTLCWHPKLELVISIDPTQARAVSVLSGDCVGSTRHHIGGEKQWQKQQQ